MELDDLLEKYIEQAKICFQVDYGDKNSVKAHNKAADKMQKIVGLIDHNYGEEGVKRFSDLLDITEYTTNVWAAVHVFNNLKADNDSRRKALQIIRNIAKGDDVNALGFQHWLKEREKEIALLDLHC